MSGGVAPRCADGLSEDDILALIDLGDSQGGRVGRHWVLDPIDGTRGFVGLRQYAVCLGMLQDGEVPPCAVSRLPCLARCPIQAHSAVGLPTAVSCTVAVRCGLPGFMLVTTQQEAKTRALAHAAIFMSTCCAHLVCGADQRVKSG